jgi:hypothetical protein
MIRGGHLKVTDMGIQHGMCQLSLILISGRLDLIFVRNLNES